MDQDGAALVSVHRTAPSVSTPSLDSEPERSLVLA